MKILLVEGVPGAGAAAEAELLAAGHAVVGCDSAEPAAPCRGLDTMGECPLDGGDIDVAVVSRATDEVQSSERGALCAARARVPVVIAGDPKHAVSFGPGTHLAGSDLVAACDRAASSGLAHVGSIRRQLLTAGVITNDDVDGSDPALSFEVRREPGRLRLVIHTAPDEPRLPAITKSAAEALRRFDPHAKVIDVITESD